jgi:hypothetical protein
MVRRYVIFLAGLVLLCSACGVAQKADAAFIVGGSFVSDSNVKIAVLCIAAPCPTFPSTLKTDNHVFLEGALGLRILDAKAVSLHLELPIAGIPSQRLHLSTGPAGPINGPNLSSLFFTPSLKVKVLPASPIAPFFSVGGGLAHFSFDQGSSSKGALQYGGGIDFKTGIPHFGLRVEARDFVSSDPDFPSFFLGGVSGQSGLHRHNVLAGGGAVLNF